MARITVDSQGFVTTVEEEPKVAIYRLSNPQTRTCYIGRRRNGTVQNIKSWYRSDDSTVAEWAREQERLGALEVEILRMVPQSQEQKAEQDEIDAQPAQGWTALNKNRAAAPPDERKKRLRQMRAALHLFGVPDAQMRIRADPFEKGQHLLYVRIGTRTHLVDDEASLRRAIAALDQQRETKGPAVVQAPHASRHTPHA